MPFYERKKLRLANYNYSQTGAYFITLCTKNKQCIFGDVVGDGVHDIPELVLTERGKFVKQQIETMNSIYEDINVEKYIVMPNHVHLLIRIYKADAGSSGTPTPTNDTIPRFVSTLKRFCNKHFGENVWQRSYNDHIVRDEKDYLNIWQYIDCNYLKWKADCFYNGNTI